MFKTLFKSGIYRLPTLHSQSGEHHTFPNTNSVTTHLSSMGQSCIPVYYFQDFELSINANLAPIRSYQMSLVAMYVAAKQVFEQMHSSYLIKIQSNLHQHLTFYSEFNIADFSVNLSIQLLIYIFSIIYMSDNK